MVQRVERAFAALAARFVDAGASLDAGAAKQSAGQGWATFLGVGSPLTHVAGADGQLTNEHLASLEAFFFTRGADAILEVADVWQLEPWLVSLGYELAGSEQVLVAELGADHPPRPEVIDCADRLEEWAQSVQLGFGMEPSPSGYLLGRILASQTALGIVRNGELAGSAAFAVVGEVGYCFADSTLPAHRGQGLQQMLIQHRLWLTAQSSGRFCVAETAPGSGSERNYVRCGFAPVFQRQTFTKQRLSY